MKWRDRMPWSSFSECWALSQLFTLSSFTFIKKLFSSSSLSAIRVVSSEYLRLLIFLLAILTPACDSFSLAFHMMYSAQKLNKQGNNIQKTYSFPNFERVCCSTSGCNCCFLTCIRVSKETGKVVWYGIPICLKIFYSLLWSTVKGFGIVNKAKLDVFLKLLLFQWSNGCWQFDLWFLCVF